MPAENSGSPFPRPIVTIGMPVYNEAATLQRSIDSVLAQTEGRFKLVILDNCSTDDTLVIAERAAAADARVSVVGSEKNQGSIWNFARLVPMVETPHFGWISGHDVWRANFLTELLALFASVDGLAVAVPKAEFLASVSATERGDIDVSLVYEVLDKRPVSRVIRISRTLGYCTPALGLFDTELFRRSGSMPKLNFAPDVVLMTQLAAVGGFTTSPSVVIDLHRPTTDMKSYQEKTSGRAASSKSNFVSALRFMLTQPRLIGGLSALDRLGVSICSSMIWAFRWRRPIAAELSPDFLLALKRRFFGSSTMKVKMES